MNETQVMNGGHKKIVCSCGAVIMQCRCFSHAKALETRQDGCAACIARKTSQLRQAPRAKGGPK